MALWLFYTDAQASDIEQACDAAAQVLQERGFTAEQAQDAALAAADLAEDYAEERTPDANAVVAWFAAEDAAVRALAELAGEDWPHQAALVWSEED